ncbi:serralysin [Rhizobium tropici]|uniref:Serralysin n=1 Tax=Rhizobium tropici TaxID=398 RepID=A0ABR6R8X5_RHITR|nr:MULTISPECIES: calcium-binding protein [Rhizobium]MBB4245279.1 serralysin [Rhizobium tropici]MBB5596637.1 serralysin [Rhizobium tropici]MBB6495613.1 serralysin [Rhizobium tropici]MDK4741483.1 calcium-binding protein [Rhizobium sp. CNPSo 3464]
MRTYQHIDLNTENNIYGFGSPQRSYQLTSSGKQHDIGFAIHDTGGTDTIDFSGSTAGTILDLRAGHFSSVNGCSNNVSIFAGHNADATDYYVENGIGSSHDDVLIGNDGANVLDGRGGADRMAGNGGDDIYFVDSPDDVIHEKANGGNDTVILLSKNLKIPQIANVEHIIYADELPGNDGNILCGGAGEDTLTGGEGQDTFRFSPELGNGNVERIKDFRVINDMILLDSLVFESGGGDGALALGAFHGSAEGIAHNAGDRIIYNTDSGALSYDVDGGGELAAIQVAQLTPNLRLSAADFIVI